MWSVASIWLILLISNSKTAILISVVEFAAIIVHASAYTQFVQQEGMFYNHLEQIIEILTILQAVILTAGSPWRGMANRFKSIRMADLLWWPNTLSRVQDSRCNSEEST